MLIRHDAQGSYARHARSNPLRYADPTGHWIESAVDIAFIAYDLHDISQNGLNWENGLSLAADVAGLVLPVVTGGGLIVRGVAHADDVGRAVSHIDDGARAVNSTDDIARMVSIGDGQGFVRTIDRAPSNSKNYTLRASDADGVGLSTIADPPVSPSTVMRETGRNRAVRIPAEDIPDGLEWKKTKGHYGKQILDDNHWELWSPKKRSELSASEYVEWWNQEVAPDLANRSKNWQEYK